MTDQFTAAVAAQVLAATGARAELLQSIVRTAQAIYRAEASSIALLDPVARDFVFQAVSGQGSNGLIGSRFQAGAGIGGTVAQTGEPVLIDDLTRETRFARDIAEGTGYVPSAMMIAPLLSAEETTGLLYVLDRGDTGRPPLEELNLLVAFADQAALAIAVGEAAREAAALMEAVDGRGGDLAQLAGLVRRLRGARPAQREAAANLIAGLDGLLENGAGQGFTPD